MKNREVKRRAREEKSVWLEQMGDEEERYAENGRTRELYQTAKKRRQVAAVKNNRGEVIKDKIARLVRWAEPSEEVLVREALTNPVKENEVETDDISEMALKKTKSGRRQRVEEHLELTVSQKSCTKQIVIWQ